MPHILPSILSADFANLRRDVERVEAGGARMLHFDVMDGHFVPNITVGIPVLRSLRRATQSVLDVHLMISNPDAFIGAFVEAGADQISVHQEACPHLDRTLRAIQAEGAKAGVVINPGTPISVLQDVLHVTDFVLVMSVNPGFGGQKFIPRSIDKIRALSSVREAEGLSFQIEVDGGVNQSNVADLVAAGCEWLVAGSSVFDSQDVTATYSALQRAAEQAALVRA